MRSSYVDTLCEFFRQREKQYNWDRRGRVLLCCLRGADSHRETDVKESDCKECDVATAAHIILKLKRNFLMGVVQIIIKFI